MEGDGRGLRRAEGDQVVGAHERQFGERRRAAVDHAVVDQSQLVAVLGEQGIGLGCVDQATEQV